MPGGKHGGKAVFDDDYDDDYDDYDDRFYDDEEEEVEEEHVNEPAKDNTKSRPGASSEEDPELHSLLCQLIPGFQEAEDAKPHQVGHACQPCSN